LLIPHPTPPTGRSKYDLARKENTKTTRSGSQNAGSDTRQNQKAELRDDIFSLPNKDTSSHTDKLDIPAPNTTPSSHPMIREFVCSFLAHVGQSFPPIHPLCCMRMPRTECVNETERMKPSVMV
jgi:hypothetical protein